MDDALGLGDWATQESNLGFFGNVEPQRSVLTTILVALMLDGL